MISLASTYIYTGTEYPDFLKNTLLVSIKIKGEKKKKDLCFCEGWAAGAMIYGVYECRQSR